MKQILLALLLIPAFSFGQDADAFWREQQEKEKQEAEKQKKLDVIFPKDSLGNYQFRSVVNVENTDAQTLYSKGKLCIAEIFVNNKEVTQLNDDVAKIIIAKPVIITKSTGLLSGGLTTVVKYQIKIECKDNKYRYTIDGFGYRPILNKDNNDYLKLESTKLNFYSKKMWQELQYNVYQEINLIIKLIENRMANKLSDF